MSKCDLESSVNCEDDPAVARLGPVVLGCRDRTVRDQWLARGESLLEVYGKPVIIACFPTCGAALVFGLMYEILNHPAAIESEYLMWFVAGVSYLVSCAALYRWILRRATKVSLALHQGGIRFRERTYRFDEIRSISGGRPRGRTAVATLTLCGHLGKVIPAYRDVIREAEVTEAASLTLVMKNGRSHALTSVAILCETEDYGRFLEWIQVNQPRLFAV